VGEVEAAEVEEVAEAEEEAEVEVADLVVAVHVHGVSDIFFF